MRWSILLIERYRTATKIAGTVLISWLLSGFVAEAIGLFLPQISPGAPPERRAIEDASMFSEPSLSSIDSYLVICQRNIFDSQKRSPCEAAAVEEEGGEGPVDMDSAPTKSDMAVTLLGTMVFTKPSMSRASIAERGGKEAKTYYIDDDLLGEAKIYDIQRNKVYIIRNGHREYLQVENLPSIYSDSGVQAPAPGSEGGIRVQGDKVTMPRSKVEQILGDLNNIIQQARMVPNFENGAVNGFKIFAIRPGSFFEEMGLKNGDIVHRINGTEINSVEKALPMLQLARNENQISIDLSRGGKKKTLSLDIQ